MSYEIHGDLILAEVPEAPVVVFLDSASLPKRKGVSLMGFAIVFFLLFCLVNLSKLVQKQTSF